MFPLRNCFSDDYAKNRRSQIGERAGKYGAGEISAGETIYMTVADNKGYHDIIDTKQLPRYGIWDGTT